MSDFLNILLLALLGSVFALIGGVIFLTIDKWRKILTRYSIPFAAGVMLTIAFVGLLPEAIHFSGERALTIVLLTILAVHIFERTVFSLYHGDHHHHHDSDRVTKGGALLVIIGDTIHNFIDGVAIAAAYIVNPGLGLVTALSTFLHEIPHEIGDFGLLLKAGYAKRKIFAINIISALSTVAGALLIYFFPANEEVMGVLLAIAAGMFIYLGASDFMPQIYKRSDKFGSISALLLGFIVMFVVLGVVPHSH